MLISGKHARCKRKQLRLSDIRIPRMALHAHIRQSPNKNREVLWQINLPGTSLLLFFSLLALTSFPCRLRRLPASAGYLL
jgi:hypothetical protein